jgi:hypothetical protein
MQDDSPETRKPCQSSRLHDASRPPPQAVVSIYPHAVVVATEAGFFSLPVFEIICEGAIGKRLALRVGRGYAIVFIPRRDSLYPQTAGRSKPGPYAARKILVKSLPRALTDSAFALIS